MCYSAGVQEGGVVVRSTAEAEPERAEPDRVAGAEKGGDAGRAPDVRRRGRGDGAPAVREAPDEAPAGPVPEQDAVAAPAHQGHVRDRPGAHRQGGDVRRRHSVLRDPVPGGRRPGDGRAQPAGRPPAHTAAAARPPSPSVSELRESGEWANVLAYGRR